MTAIEYLMFVIYQFFDVARVQGQKESLYRRDCRTATPINRLYEKP